jgi:polysaccharide chain length determinant protein (PEP-CTERM system associated)
MTTSNSGAGNVRSKPRSSGASVPIEHYLRLILHRKWIVVGVFLLVTGGAFFYAQRLPNIYSSETVILVDPQKVPESYVKSTVTGDIRNRLGTLSQQILSATRLQKIIDTLNLYPEERKTMAREDVIMKMRSDVATSIVSDFGGSQDLQAFKIQYFGRDPRLVAQVTNQLASLFIDENWKAREQQATGTTEFLENQLQETRSALEAQEAKIRDFRLKHIGEMPEQQTADLQILGQLQAQLQLEGEALSRAESQKNMLESMGGQSSMVVDLDGLEPKVPAPSTAAQDAPARPQPVSPLVADQAQLAALRTKYSDAYPDIVRLKKKIEQEEARAATSTASSSASSAAVPVPPPPAPAASPEPAPPVRPVPAKPAPATYMNPVIQSQIKSLDAEIQKHKDEQQRLSKLVAGYRTKLDAIPVREQEITALTRDYEMSKTHYSQLLDREMSAETATQLEIRQKGEKFEVLDPAIPAERPTRPNRAIIHTEGALAGLILGLLAALATELLGMSISEPQDVKEASGLDVLGVIPVILTQSDRSARRRRLILAAASATFAVLVIGAIIFLRVHSPA